MSEQAPQKIEGLELWLPSDSFSQSHNSLPLQETMSKLQTLSVLAEPGEDTIYCTGGSGQIIYHSVTDEAVARRIVTLTDEFDTLTSSLDRTQVIDQEGLQEEARLRELHLGLGRTSLFLASAAEDGADFKQAAHNLQLVFEMLDQPIHEYEELTTTSLHSMGLIYMFVQAARKFKSLSREDATNLSHAISKGILPFSIGRSDQKTEKWETHHAKSFVERISFNQPQPIKRPAGKTRKRSKSEKSKTLVLHNDEVAHDKKKEAEPRTRGQTFIYRLVGDRTLKPYSYKLARAHANFFNKEDPQAFEIRNDNKVELAVLGVSAYIEAVRDSKSGNETTAGHILDYIVRKGSNSRRPLLPLVVVGNLMSARLNASGKFANELELPGLRAAGIARGFEALRQMLDTTGTTQSEIDVRLLGDIVQEYIEIAFQNTGDEEDAFSYETPLAPKEGIVSTARFAAEHDIDRTTLERVLSTYGVDARSYRFGKYVQKGLNLDDQETLSSVMDELRVERAPHGYRSVSTLSILINVPKPELDKLIEEQGMQVPTHRFRSKLGRSLSPENQEILVKLLGKEERFFPIRSKPKTP